MLSDVRWTVQPRPVAITIRMALKTPETKKYDACSYELMQTFRKEHREKNMEVPVSVLEFSNKYSENWKTVSEKEKSKTDELSKQVKYPLWLILRYLPEASCAHRFGL